MINLSHTHTPPARTHTEKIREFHVYILLWVDMNVCVNQGLHPLILWPNYRKDDDLVKSTTGSGGIDRLPSLMLVVVVVT